jgi:glycolate oxidase FAD binding subunit
VAVEAAREFPGFALAGRLPENVFVPQGIDELAALLRECDDAGRAVVVFGGNTLQSLGNAPARYDVAIDMRALAAVVEYEPRDFTISVEAGITVAALERELAERGQFVPLDAPRPSLATVGGTLASGWLGPRRARYGRSRDYAIGATAVLPDGTVAKSGGMVVKNVTGYDVAKLYIGSLGTLGTIAKANLKTLPVPEVRRIAIAALPERTRARAIANIAALGEEPAAALVVRGFANEIDGRDSIEGRMILLFEGTARAVERATREVRSALGAAGVPETRLVDREAPSTFAHVIDAYVALLGARSATYGNYGLPADLATRRELLAASAHRNELILETIEDLCNGDLVARVSTNMTSEFGVHIGDFEAYRRDALPRTRVLAAPGGVRELLEGWSDVPSSLDTMRALKARFDPRGTLSPGRFVGGI